MASWPTSIVDFPEPGGSSLATDLDLEWSMPEHVGNTEDEVTAIQTSLGVGVKGPDDTVKDRLDRMEVAIAAGGGDLVTPVSHYTLEATDAGDVVLAGNSGATNVTVPPNSAVDFPIGTQVRVVQVGLNPVTLVAGSGVTILVDQFKSLRLTGQGAMVTLLQIATDSWIVGEQFNLKEQLLNWTPELFFGGVEMTYGHTPKQKGQYHVDRASGRCRAWFMLDLGQDTVEDPITIPAGLASMPLPVTPHTPAAYEDSGPFPLFWPQGDVTVFDNDLPAGEDLHATYTRMMPLFDKFGGEPDHVYFLLDGGTLTAPFPTYAVDAATNTAFASDHAPLVWGDQDILFGQYDFFVEQPA